MKSVTPKDVVRMFRESARYGPWPGEVKCQMLAKHINTLSQISPSRPARPESLQWMLPRLPHLIGERLDDLGQARKQLDATAPVYLRDYLTIEERNFRRLLDAVKGALPHVHDHRTPAGVTAYWHQSALSVAYYARAVWQAAGRKTIGSNADSPLIKFVIKALAARGIGPKSLGPATVASVLRRKL